MALPGVRTIIKDRFYSISRQDSPVGPRIVVLAKRTTDTGTGNVADLDVVLCTNEQDVITAFGVDSACHRSFVELIAGGAERIYMVPLPSDTVFNHDEATITSTNAGGSIFNTMFIAAEAAQPDMILAWGRGGHPYDWDLQGATPNASTVDSEFGFYANNSATVANSWVLKIGAAVQRISQDTHPVFAVIGLKPYSGTNEVMTPGQVSIHLAATALASRDSDVLVTDQVDNVSYKLKGVGRSVVVVGTELRPSNYPVSWGYANGVSAFAAALSRMAAYTSTINKTVYNIASLRYNPSKAALTSLTSKGVNCVLLNFNKAPIFSDGLTFAGADSDYTRLTTLRIINEATLVVRQSCQKYIGQPSTLQVRNSMETSITSALRGMQQLGAILDSDFAIRYIANESKALIDLVITPAFELRNIEVQISVALG